MTPESIVHVAVAVIKNSKGQYFIAKRPQNSHQGGLWEFPGGKVESDETVLSALKRELFEEIGIILNQATPLIKIRHDYSDKSVLLDVWCVDSYTEEPYGKEGQKTFWLNKDDFSLYDFPAANIPIIKAIQLPDKYMITGEFNTEDNLINKIRVSIKNGISLIQFRAPLLEEKKYFNLAKNIFLICEKENTKLLLNTSINKYKKYSAEKFSHGIHLNSKELKIFQSDEINSNSLVSTSTHNINEIHRAEEKQVDLMLLSPVKKTLSHPGSIPLGWGSFENLTGQTNIPVYALGGMTAEDLNTAKIKGAQGIAAIGEFWNVE